MLSKAIMLSLNWKCNWKEIIVKTSPEINNCIQDMLSIDEDKGEIVIVQGKLAQ